VIAALQEFDAAGLDAEQSPKKRLIQLEQRMTIKLGGMMVLAIGIVATVVKVLSLAPAAH
jgi:hypothetical protein